MLQPWKRKWKNDNDKQNHSNSKEIKNNTFVEDLNQTLYLKSTVLNILVSLVYFAISVSTVIILVYIRYCFFSNHYIKEDMLPATHEANKIAPTVLLLLNRSARFLASFKSADATCQYKCDPAAAQPIK